jgi:hypothetical protein
MPSFHPCKDPIMKPSSIQVMEGHGIIGLIMRAPKVVVSTLSNKGWLLWFIEFY